MEARTYGIFKSYLEEAIGQHNASVAFSAFDKPGSASVRMNPWKTDGHSPLSVLGNCPRRVEWSRNGYFLSERPVFTLDPCFHAGAYYVQDSSSMFVGFILDYVLGKIPLAGYGPGRPLRVLDLCAAPGGKTTDASAILRRRFSDNYLIVSNEVMSGRAGVLAENVALWGDPNIVVTSADPAAFSFAEGYFDLIIADVPCSGEGMFRKDPEAVEQWSPEAVAACQARQRRIVADVWPALRKGGILIYSTCTFNRYENDLNVKWIADNLGAGCLFASGTCGMEYCGDFDGVLRTECGFSLVPGLVEGEGQYCSALVKDGNMEMTGKHLRRESGKTGQLPHIKADLSSFVSGRIVFGCRGELIKAFPDAVVPELQFLEKKLRVLSSGCAVGMIKGRDFIPDPDLALSMVFRKNSFEMADVDRLMALKYLHHDTLVFRDYPKGILTVCHDGLPLGFVKNLGNRTNIIHPVGRRIRMDIGNVSG